MADTLASCEHYFVEVRCRLVRSLSDIDARERHWKSHSPVERGAVLDVEVQVWFRRVPRVTTPPDPLSAGNVVACPDGDATLA